MTAAAALLGAAVLTAPAARAVDEVDLPRHDDDYSRLSLIGASESVFAVHQAGVPERFLLGPEGSQLSAQSRDLPVDYPLPSVDGVAGYVTYVDPNVSWDLRRLHLLTLATGAESVIETEETVVALTGDGWIGYRDGTLTRHLLDGGDTTLFTGLDDAPAVAADRDGALVGRTVKISEYELDYTLDLVDFATGAVDRVSSSGSDVNRLAISPTTIAWISHPEGNNGVLVNRRPRSGGAITAVRETNQIPFANQALAVVGDRVGWLLDDSTGAWLRILTGGSTRRVALPHSGSDLTAVGDRLITAVSGPRKDAGVYAVGLGGAARVATVPTQPARWLDLTLSSGTLRYTDTSVYGRDSLPIWQSAVTGSGAAQVSAATLLPVRAYNRPGVAFSAARGLVGDPATGRFRLLDRGAVVHTLRHSTEEQSQLNLSGPYALIDGTLYGPTGIAILQTHELGAHGFDLYGSLLAYGDGNDVWVLDVAKPRSATNPRRITTGCGGCGNQVSIWGTTVAWSRPDRSFAVQTIGSTQIRELSGAGLPGGLTLGEGVLALTGIVAGEFTSSSYVLDLRSPESTPVALTGLTLKGVDDHRFVAERTSTGDMVIGRLPFDADYRPRLIGAVAATRFSAAGNGRATWAPQFDTTKPLTGVTLTIRSSTGRTIRTLTGTGPDGSIRDLRWDGRTGAGRPAAPGRYTWQLVAQAADGDGALTAANGVRPVSGAITLAR